ncbi:hypothetical protein Vadar_015721 [Vaccinium darrowii]|uniref:Uncharacterized protein n=1 Tax=Vaccinium darrowii TaxID=229202 RepID=A0ACB7XZJ9_9ERIC|nr:hypothetical protein Vadar_015721 [Vaccinium darrowii]
MPKDILSHVRTLIKTLTVPVFEYLYLDLKSDAFQLGTCNGIFCVVNSFLELALWNPATREIRSISSDPYLTKDAYYFTRAFGFGLDLVTNDYKVVLIETVADEQMVDFDYSMVQGYWTKELVLGPFAGATHPPGFWKRGELLVNDKDGCLFLANPNTLEMKDLSTEALSAFVYHESLISVMRRDEGIRQFISISQRMPAPETS